MLSSIWQTVTGDRIVVPPRQPFKDGLTLIFEPESEASLEVIFIHDIGDNSQETWKNQDADEKTWPVLMTDRFTEARLFLYGYDTRWATDLASLVDPIHLAREAALLLTALGGLRGPGEKPLVFFAHGFGGLVYEYAVVQPKSTERSWLTSCRHGAFLFGTPHQNAGLAEWAIITARRLGIPCKRTPQLQDWTSLKPQIKSTSDMQSKFRELIEDLDSVVKIVGCWATKPDPYSNLKLSSEWAVAPEFHLPVVIKDSHFGMTNLSIKSDSFQAIKVVFESLAKELVPTKPESVEPLGTMHNPIATLLGDPNFPNLAEKDEDLLIRALLGDEAQALAGVVMVTLENDFFSQDQVIGGDDASVAVADDLSKAYSSHRQGSKF